MMLIPAVTLAFLATVFADPRTAPQVPSCLHLRLEHQLPRQLQLLHRLVPNVGWSMLVIRCFRKTIWFGLALEVQSTGTTTISMCLQASITTASSMFLNFGVTTITPS